MWVKCRKLSVSTINKTFRRKLNIKHCLVMVCEVLNQCYYISIIMTTGTKVQTGFCCLFSTTFTECSHVIVRSISHGCHKIGLTCCWWPCGLAATSMWFWWLLLDVSLQPMYFWHKASLLSGCWKDDNIQLSTHTEFIFKRLFLPITFLYSIIPGNWFPSYTFCLFFVWFCIVLSYTCLWTGSVLLLLLPYSFLFQPLVGMCELMPGPLQRVPLHYL